MAKVQAPLYSGAAVGTVGKVLTFSTVHGVTVVYKKPTPTIPDTPAQVDEKAAMAAAAAEWNALNLNEYDVTAWNNFAKLRKEKCSGYAFFVKRFIYEYNRGRSWVRFKDMEITAIGTTSVSFRVWSQFWHEPIHATRTGSWYHGDTDIILTPAGGQWWEGTFAALQRGMDFHLWTYNMQPYAKYGQSGAYYVKLKWAW